jgi:hypothetical protein
MNTRHVVSSAFFAAASAAFLLNQTAVSGQTQTAKPAPKPVPAAARANGVPRAPDGHPDLQGVWSWAQIVPLERPATLAGKEQLTDEDVARLEEAAAESRVDRAPRPGDTGTYNQFWFDRGTKVNESRRSSLITDPADGRIPPLTAEMQKREEERAKIQGGEPRTWEDRTLSERCVVRPWSGPPITPGNYNNNLQIFQTKDFIVLHVEQSHDSRIVPMDGRPHLDKNIRQILGDSRGHWEGDTLVVDTTNFTDQLGKSAVRGIGGNLHLIERFTRIDADTLNYEFTVDDPTAYTKQWTALLPMAKTEDKIYEYACFEGDETVTNVLRGTRLQEKLRAEEAAKKEQTPRN